MRAENSLPGLIVLLSVPFGLIAGEPKAVQASLVYAYAQDNSLGTLDLNTGVFNPIGTVNLNNMLEGSYLVGIGTGGPNTLTAIDNLGEFYTINTTTLEATDQGNSIIHGDGAGGTNSTLYVFDDNAGGLYSYNFNTGLDGG